MIRVIGTKEVGMIGMSRRSIVRSAGIAFASPLTGMRVFGLDAGANQPVTTAVSGDLVNYVANGMIRSYSLKKRSSLTSAHYKHLESQTRLLARHVSNVQGLDAHFQTLASSTAFTKQISTLDPDTIKTVMSSSLPSIQQTDPTIGLPELADISKLNLSEAEWTRGFKVVASKGLSGVLHLCADNFQAQANDWAPSTNTTYEGGHHARAAHLKLVTSACGMRKYYDCLATIYALAAVFAICQGRSKSGPV